MSLPFLLLGLYLGLLAVSVGLCSWAGHTPPPEEAQRVTDAAERAGLSHLIAPAKLGGGAALAFAVASSTWALLSKQPVVWFLLPPLIAPVLVGGALFYCARRALRAAGQLVTPASADGRLTLAGRSVLGLVLCCEATLGLLLLGTYSLAAPEMGSRPARFLVFIVGSAIAISAVVFARATTSAHLASTRGTEQAQAGPHAGSLAALVASTFHLPILKLLALVLLSTFGHCALLSMEGMPTDAAELWLYPHLLKLLGLFGLLFAGMVVRTSEEELGGEGWVRGAAVYLVLMIGGAWSLSSQLPAGWSRSVPAGLSFFYVALGLALWTARGAALPRSNLLSGHAVERATGASSSRVSAAVHALRKMPAVLLFFGLLCVLLLSSVSPGGEEAASGAVTVLPAPALSSLLLAGALAASPIAFTWLLAQGLSGGSREAAHLAYAEGEFDKQLRTTPSPRLLLALPLLASVIALSALTARLSDGGELNSLGFLLLGLGGATGTLVVASLTGFVELSATPSSRGIQGLLLKQQKRSDDGAALDFEAAIVLCREATGRADLAWLLLCLVPLATALIATPLLLPIHVQWLTLGLGVGAVFTGIGMELLVVGTEDPAGRGLAHLGFVSCLAQGLWLLAAGSFPG